MALEYFKLQRALFLKYIQTVDFQSYDPKNIYGNSLGALCSSYSEMIDSTEMAMGISVDSSDFRRNNVHFFKKDVFEQEVHDWLEG